MADLTSLKRSRINWKRTHRLINSSFPPIDIFEDIADPADWDLLCSAEMKTNPRLEESIGQLARIPLERRVSGPGASYLMAPFTHISTDRPGRFHDGRVGAYYAADAFETALFEVIHHRGLFYAATREPAGWISDLRELVGSIDQTLVDLRKAETATDKGHTAYRTSSESKTMPVPDHADLLKPDDYRASQQFATLLRNQGENGIVYPSVRHAPGTCIALFYPDLIPIPKQGKHLALHWDGTAVDQIKLYKQGGNEIYRIETDS